MTFRRIVRIGSKPSPLWEDLALSRLHPALLPSQGKALQPWCCAQNRFLRTLQPTTTRFLRHILSRKLTFINPLLQCHWHPFFSIMCRLMTQTVKGKRLHNSNPEGILDCSSVLSKVVVEMFALFKLHQTLDNGQDCSHCGQHYRIWMSLRTSD